MPVEIQKMYFQGKILKNEHHLDDYGIKSGNTIHMLFQLNGRSDDNEWEETFQRKRAWKCRLTRARNNAMVEMSEQKGESNKREKYEDEYDEMIQNFTELIGIGKRLNKVD